MPSVVATETMGFCGTCVPRGMGQEAVSCLLVMKLFYIFLFTEEVRLFDQNEVTLCDEWCEWYYEVINLLRSEGALKCRVSLYCYRRRPRECLQDKS